MELPAAPVTLTVNEIAELNQKLSDFRHDINNHLALIMAGLEVVRAKPQLSERMIATVSEQPPKITEAIVKFSAEFDKALHITR